jgi:hypothetical protein
MNGDTQVEDETGTYSLRKVRADDSGKEEEVMKSVKTT